MQSLPGGHLSHSSREIGKVAVSRSRDGLPRIIPTFARKEIRRGNTMIIQLWLTFFGLYRVLPCKGAPKFSTILNPGPKISEAFLGTWTGFLRNSFFPSLEEMHAEDLVDVGTKVLAKPEPFVITSFSADKRQDPAMEAVSSQYKKLNKTAPQAYTAEPTAFAHRVHAAYCWAHGEWALTAPNLLKDYLEQIPGGEGTTQSFWTLLLKTADFWPAVRNSHRASIKVAIPRSDGKEGLVLSDGSWSGGALWPIRKSATILPNVNPTGKNASGRLALLEEAAGKVRVVALLDVWSQWALKPLHNWIFDLCP